MRRIFSETPYYGVWGAGCVPFSGLINIKGNIIVWELGPKNMTMI
jgi:hypothetical protein